MQTVSPTFTAHTTADVRPIAWQLRIAFDKTIVPTVTFFTLDTSLLDGEDILPPTEDNVIQASDYYVYDSYTDRVIQMEWQREEDVPYSVNLAFADVTLNNYDNLFTAGSSLDAYLLPRRPIRILAGFGGETIPQFVGLTEKAPRVDSTSRTAWIHAQDFLSFIFDKPLSEMLVFENKYTHEVLQELFEFFGLTTDNFDLETSFNLINFVYFEKDTKLGAAVKQLIQAEIGSLYLDENGKIIFKNRQRPTPTSVYTFDESNTVDYQTSDEGDIINVVEIKANVREVQPSQPVYSLGAPVPISAGDSEVFFSFEDPLTSLSTITEYTANTQEDGSGTNITADVTVTDTDLFATAVKVTFNNTNADGFLTDLTMYGTPARIVKEIYLRAQDDDSVDKYEEQILTIENDYIQTDSQAEAIALSILNIYKDYANTVELEVKGTPALQLGDVITIDVHSINDDFTITKIANVMAAGQFRQRLTAKKLTTYTFFILDESLLDGDEVLAV